MSASNRDPHDTATGSVPRHEEAIQPDEQLPDADAQEQQQELLRVRKDEPAVGAEVPAADAVEQAQPWQPEERNEPPDTSSLEKPEADSAEQGRTP